jgi:HAD superfamily hydrolase (TIGR01450 family)
MVDLKRMECFLLDMDGTVHISGEAIDGAADAVERMRKVGRVLFLTNNTSVSRLKYVEKLNGMGIAAGADDIYTAGNATIDYLKQTAPHSKIYLFGTDSLKEEFTAAGLRLVENEPDLVVVGFHTDAHYRDFAEVCAHIRGGVPFIATHPDLNCPVRGGYIPDVGSFLKLIEASCGKLPLLVCGKPNRPIGDGILRLTGAAPAQTVMIGDRLSTDMVFAKNNGFVSALVLTGEAAERDLEASGLRVDRVLRSIADWDSQTYHPEVNCAKKL